MDRRAVERTLLVLIWLATGAEVAFSEDGDFPVVSESWSSTPANLDNRNSTASQQTSNELTTATMLISSSAAATDAATSSNDYDNDTRTYNSTAAAAAEISAGPNPLDVPSSVASNSSDSSDAASNSPVISASPNTITYDTESLTSADTMANSQNSTTTEPGSSTMDSEADGETRDNRTGSATEGSSWSFGTTQGGGNGVDNGVGTSVQESLGAEDPSQVDQGSWSSFSTALSDSNNNNNSNSTMLQQQTNAEISTTAPMPGFSAANNISGNDSSLTSITVASASAGPFADIAPPFSAPSSDALSNQSNFTNTTDSMVSIPNSTTSEPDSNSVSNTQNHDYSTTFETDNYNWSSATTQGIGGGGGGDGEGGVVTTGVHVALGAENPFPDYSPGSWNGTTTIFASDVNTTQAPSEELPAAPIDNNANNTVATTPASSTNDTFASSPSSASANGSDAGRNFSADSALYTSYTTASYFTDVNSTNSLEIDTVPNTTVNSSEDRMNVTGFEGTDSYNWSSVTMQSNGGAVVGGGGGNWSNSSVSSISTAENQTTDITTASSYRTILCYNCSDGNCSRTGNDTDTCVSSTGTCYTQYDPVATALSYSCAPLLFDSNGCPSGGQATRIAMTVCEMCCTEPFCNQRSSSEMEQMCRQQLRSSVGPIGGGGRGGGGVYQLAALIAAIRFCTFFGAASSGD